MSNWHNATVRFQYTAGPGDGVRSITGVSLQIFNIFADGFRFEFSCRPQADPLALDNYTEWGFDEARARIRNILDVDAMRRKIRSALDLDEAVLGRITHTGNTRALLSAYNPQERTRYELPEVASPPEAPAPASASHSSAGGSGRSLGNPSRP